VDKIALMTERLPRDEVDIPGLGTVTVRGLSRYELLLAGKAGTDDLVASERRLVSMGMVDPEMSEDDVAAWQKCSPAGEIAPVVLKINELSGITREASKEAYKSLRDES